MVINIYKNCVCRFFEKLGDIASALKFLVLSHCQDEAFAMAQVISIYLKYKNYVPIFIPFRHEIIWSNMLK